MPELRKVVFHPTDRTRGYKLWSHGFIEPIGLQPVPVQDHPQDEANFPDEWAVTNPVWDICVTNWSTPSGYTLTSDGEIRGFGGVTDPGIHGHLPTAGFNIWRWLFMNPNNDGSGYMWNFVGWYTRWGPTAPALALGTDGTIPNYGQDFARDVKMDWATKKWAVLGRNGQVDATFTVTGGGVTPRNNNTDAFRSIVVRDWGTSTPKVLAIDFAGWMTALNSWGSFSGQPIGFQGRDVVRDLALVWDGSGGQPMELAFGIMSGAVYRWYVSDPPVAIWNAPVNASTVTVTSRPGITVGWNDPDGDTITSVDVRIYGPSLASITDPDAPGMPVPRQRWLTDARSTGFTPDFDLENGTWQGFIKVRDNANDQSTWTKVTWTQNVTKPAAPTIAAPVYLGNSVRLTVAGTTNASRFIYVEYSDDGGTTWAPVRGANPGPSILTGGVYIFDYEAPFNEDRKYRARIASNAPTLSSVWSSTVTANLFGERWNLRKIVTGEEIDLKVQPGVKKSDPMNTGKFMPLVGEENIVLDAGWSHGDLPLTVRALKKADRKTLVNTFLKSGATMLLRNPLGDHWYVRVTGDLSRDLMHAMPMMDENTPIRDAHTFEVNFTVVRRPSA